MIRVLPALLLIACAGETPPEDHAPDLSSRVTWANVQTAQQVPVTTLPAEAVGRPGATSHLGPPGGGRIDAWAVAPGQRVAEGDVLAWLISPDLDALQTQVQTLDAQVDQARLAASQARQAADQGVRSQAAADLAQAELESAQARRSALARELAARRDTSTSERGRWAWRSPGPGVVQAITCSLDTVVTGSRCLTLVRPEDTQVLVRVPERHLPALEGPVTGTFTAADGRTWELTLAAAAPAVDPHARTRELRFDVDQPVLPGLSGQAILRAPAGPGVGIVPEAALTRVEGAPAVMRQNERGTGDPVVVRIIGREPGQVHVTGLAPEDAVAVKGVFLLKSLVLLDEDATGHSH